MRSFSLKCGVSLIVDPFTALRKLSAAALTGAVPLVSIVHCNGNGAVDTTSVDALLVLVPLV